MDRAGLRYATDSATRLAESVDDAFPNQFDLEEALHGVEVVLLDQPMRLDGRPRTAVLSCGPTGCHLPDGRTIDPDQVAPTDPIGFIRRLIAEAILD